MTNENTMTFEELKQKLATMSMRDLEALAKNCGLNVHTLYRTGKGKTKPHKSTLRTIQEAIASADSKDSA